MIKKILESSKHADCPDSEEDYRLAVKNDAGQIIKTITSENGAGYMSEINAVLDMRVEVDSAIAAHHKGAEAVKEVDYSLAGGILIKGCVFNNGLYLAFIDSTANKLCSVTNCVSQLIEFAELELGKLNLDVGQIKRNYFEVTEAGHVDHVLVDKSGVNWKPVCSGRNARNKGALIGVAGSKVANFLLT